MHARGTHRSAGRSARDEAGARRGAACRRPVLNSAGPETRPETDGALAQARSAAMALTRVPPARNKLLSTARGEGKRFAFSATSRAAAAPPTAASGSHDAPPSQCTAILPPHLSLRCEAAKDTQF
jgi:hypothetical protein